MATILAVAQSKEGRVQRVGLEAVAAAQALASACGGEVVVALLGAGDEAAAQLAGCDVSKVVHANSPTLEQYTPGAYAGALTLAIEALDAAWTVLPHSYQSADFMARLAVRSDSALIPEVTAFSVEEGTVVWSRPILGGKLQSEVVSNGDRTLVSVQSGAWSVDQVQAGSAGLEPWPAALDGIEADREILGTQDSGGEQIDLSQAEAIVAVGRGIGDEEKMDLIRELAAALGAEIAASRPVVDNGWLERDRQIGSSGQTVTPKLYIAVGISGAIQHTVGMKGSQTIVAINKDAGAPIFSVSDYGLVGDLHEVLPLLTVALQEARSSD